MTQNAEISGEETDREAVWGRFVDSWANSETSILEEMRAHSGNLWVGENHKEFVLFTRMMHLMLLDARIQKRLLEELNSEIARMPGFNPNRIHAQRAEILAKDGFRLFEKLDTIQLDVYGDSPPLIQSGTSFDEALSTYHRLISHVESIWSNSCEAYQAGRFPTSVFLSILAIEEIGKLGRLWHDLLAWDQTKIPAKRVVARGHKQKHFLALVPGVVINSRLDRILGAKRLKKVLEDAESGALERLRQSCLYVDVIDGVAVFPDEAVDEEAAKFFAVLAGELWAEVLGHFPWEFSEMLDKVILFELSVGFDQNVVGRSGNAS